MGTNPLVPQGVINRVRASVVCSANPLLNVTASYLGAEGITFTPTGKSVTYIRTLTGAVRSPEPYMMLEGVMHLLRTQALADDYKRAMETDSFLGMLTVRPDSRNLSPYQYVNCSITGVETLKFTGTDAGFMVGVEGVYLTNSNLFDQSIA
jgi:hypothetical protein